MRIAIATFLLLYGGAALAHAGGHEKLTSWARHFGVHKGAGYHAPKPAPCGPAWQPEHIEWSEPLYSERPLPSPQIAPTYRPAADAGILPPPRPTLQLQREAHRGPHFFPISK